MVSNALMDKLDEIIQRQLGEAYYTPRELRYGTKAKTFLSAFDLEALAKRKNEVLEKGEDDRFAKLDLFAWNSETLFTPFPKNF